MLLVKLAGQEDIFAFLGPDHHFESGYQGNRRIMGMDPVLPPKRNRREKRDYDQALYRLEHLVENGFLEFKQWRGVATRYAKKAASYLAICQLRAVMAWSKLF